MVREEGGIQGEIVVDIIINSNNIPVEDTGTEVGEFADISVWIDNMVIACFKSRGERS